MADDIKTAPRPVPADPSTMVIFGATGDLAKRKLLPALYNLATESLLPEQFAVVGVARQTMSIDEYRDKVSRDLEEFGTAVTPGRCDWLESRLAYIGGEFDAPETFRKLAEVLADPEAKRPANCLFYLAVPPNLFGTVVRQLGDAGLLDERHGWRRVVIEKPFGRDLKTARELNQLLAEELDEHQIYRIDHYLGKETVQNVMAFRFGNGIFEPVWNRRYVDHVQITVAETVGVEQRGAYYDRTGALRDVVQNHMFQLLAITAMEPPNSFEADAVRDEREKLLRAIHPLVVDGPASVAVRGQYTAGTVDWEKVPGYREEPHVAADSHTETYAAIKLKVDNWRWAGVPFYLRTGKRLEARASEIVVQFRPAPFSLFRETPMANLDPNQLVIRVQPNEGIALRFLAKVPGPDVRLGTVRMDFSYADYFGLKSNTGYETLLYDVMTGDSTLFHRADIVETGWTVVEPLLDAWRNGDGLAFYPAGAWGPSEADALIGRDGRQWRMPGD
ncbi:MAG TPA: glucose-6-phosphate dehydrogenase [Vicinamibacterales bacterium]|nr:glucose-6-phosphate dehydrogenase [Vicinamibacterales bacterium]